jgi:hypothetical protein
MTRRRDLMCEDIFGCNHRTTIPLSQDGRVVQWRCVCGERVRSVEPEPGADVSAAGAEEE